MRPVTGNRPRINSVASRDPSSGAGERRMGNLGDGGPAANFPHPQNIDAIGFAGELETQNLLGSRCAVRALIH
jgi:hypothetical protein